MDTPEFDPLFALEHKIARRADELCRQHSTDGYYPLTHWLEAESEILSETVWDLQSRDSPGLESKSASSTDATSHRGNTSFS